MNQQNLGNSGDSQRHLQQLHIINSSRTDASSSLSSPISPEFDSITSLPSPVVTDISSPSLMDSSSRPASSRTPLSPKKKYGALTSRPSSMAKNDYQNMNSRIISEFQPMVSGLQINHNQIHSSQPKRNFSTPSGITESNSLERESQHEEAPISPYIRTVFHEGRDTENITYRWKEVRQLGKGNFSTVVLAEAVDANVPAHLQKVAIKIVLLPTNKETKNKIESSLRRELELLKIIQHPSIINLLALNVTKERYLMILPYFEGGDLFECVSKHRAQMSPLLIRRIFAEIAIGISYLHHNNIVHRDIKLENVLLNLDTESLLSLDDFKGRKLITITDFGLSRRIDPADPLLTTRCGSEDYVPPELLIGLPYDGRQSDSWALGVLLYSVMEGRLPFDPPPNRTIRGRNSRVAHRIARIEWSWVEFSEEMLNIKWAEEDWKEARIIVENLLVKREKRYTSAKVCSNVWVNDILDDDYKDFKPLRLTVDS